ncbi:S-layer homology domain-containing protein [Butyricicoccus pullicaecorum]|uniref:S-layer homology domain-containing protein n=1 Tax=Butyricicoccus pullicaecorum TaxID=501571 RepID=UPI003990AB64
MRARNQHLKRLLSLLLTVVMVLAMIPAAFAADTASGFVIGPYLLAPKTTSVVAVWETSGSEPTTIRFGTDANALGDAVTVERDPEAPAYGGVQTNIYRYKFSELTPGTRYYYEVALANGEVSRGTFRTLEENPTEIRYISITDTHKFDTKATFDAAVADYDPAFIIHGGDMVEGTGTQKEQYAFWFNSGEFIHNYPVVYACGNHDFSDYFDMYVIDTQTEEYGSAVAGNISFDYGNVHFDLMDSNPWALFQMNAETSGGKMDAATADKIEKSVQWLKDDLSKNQDKAFRILVMHHPISDPYTKMHIASVAEEGHVDMMLAGHTHSYARAVSDQPTVGAGTIYLTHQDSRAVSAKGSYMTHTIKDGVLTTQNMANGGVVGTTVTAVDKQQLAYSNISIQSGPVPCNSEIEISATITNTGKGMAAAVIPVDDNGTIKYIYGDLESDGGLSTSGEPVRVSSNGVKTLEPGESIELSGTVTLTEIGKHTVKVADVSKDIEVQFRPATFSYTNVRTKLGNGEVSDIGSDILNIKADITNIGNEDGTATATLYVGDEATLSKQYTLKAGEVKTCEFTYQFEQAGEFAVRIGDSAPETVYIEGSIQGMPMVVDQSGKGNNGYLHGAPTIGTDDKGNGTIILDGDKDYVEIPDNQNFTIDNGITGMVWAKLPVSEGMGINNLTPNGRDHNPLMTKGVSIGWGTNYLYRMAVRATGKVTVGIGFNNDNGEFFWNDDDADPNAGIKKGEWVQYVGGFDRTTGGDSYQNKYNSGHIDAPAFDSEIKNWPGASTYIGFSYTGALLTNRGRGVDRTMLAGEVSQARMYQSKLTEAEVAAVADAPSAAGPKSDDLVLWLNFDPKNIVQTGTHTTEWAEISGAPASLAYKAEIPGKSAIQATVEFSKDGKTVSGSKAFDLKSGENTIDLTGAGEGKYVRIVTKFTSNLGTEQTDIPVLYTYTLKAGESTAAWNTYADWAKGTFADGAGHQSSDAYRALSEDFDDYAGEVDEGKPVEQTAASSETTQTGTAATTETTTETKPEQPKEAGWDVDDSHWAAETIRAMMAEGVLEGDAEGRIRPDDKITREEMIWVMNTMLGIQPKADTKLDAADRSSEWAYGALTAAKDAGILQGDEFGYLCGSDYATRAEIITMIARACKVSSDDHSVLDGFTDAADIPDWAVSALAGMAAQGSLSGYTDGTLQPNDQITRAEAFNLLYQAITVEAPAQAA